MVAGDEQAGLQTLNDLAVFASKEATAAWTKLWQKLMISFVDGMTTTEDASSLICGCKKAAPVYSDEWASKVVADTADHYVLPNKDCAWIDPDGHCHHKKELNEMAVPKSKLEVPGVLH